MVKIYVLIVFLIVQGGGHKILEQPFDTREACVEAATTILAIDPPQGSDGTGVACIEVTKEGERKADAR